MKKVFSAALVILAMAFGMRAWSQIQLDPAKWSGMEVRKGEARALDKGGLDGVGGIEILKAARAQDERGRHAAAPDAVGVMDAPALDEGGIGDVAPDAGGMGMRRPAARAQDDSGLDVSTQNVTSDASVSGQSHGILLVNSDHPLPDGYQPEQLIKLYDQKARSFDLARSDIYLNKQVFEAMNRMFTDAGDAGISGFVITSGYRSREKQRQVFADSLPGVAALPGESEHETGLAFDVAAEGNASFGDSPQFDWLSAHCWDYGFILRYPKGKESITGTVYEPWHYRYVGADAARAIRDAGQTLEEYLEAY